MQKLKYTEKYGLLSIAVAFVALTWVWSCAEEDTSLTKQYTENTLPKGYALVKDSKIPDELLGKVFAEGNVPPQEVLNQAGFTGEANDYHWLVHIKLFRPDFYQSGYVSPEKWFQEKRIITTNDEIQAYLGIKGGTLGTDASLAIVANDTSVVIDRWLGKNDWSSAQPDDNGFDMYYNKVEATKSGGGVPNTVRYEGGIDFHLDPEKGKELIETLELYCKGKNQTSNSYEWGIIDDTIKLCSFSFTTIEDKESDESLFYPTAELLIKNKTYEDFLNQESIVVDGVRFVYHETESYITNKDYASESSGVFSAPLYFFSADQRAMLDEMEEFSRP